MLLNQILKKLQEMDLVTGPDFDGRKLDHPLFKKLEYILIKKRFVAEWPQDPVTLKAIDKKKRIPVPPTFVESIFENSISRKEFEDRDVMLQIMNMSENFPLTTNIHNI